MAATVAVLAVVLLLMASVDHGRAKTKWSAVEPSNHLSHLDQNRQHSTFVSLRMWNRTKTEEQEQPIRTGKAWDIINSRFAVPNQKRDIDIIRRSVDRQMRRNDSSKRLLRRRRSIVNAAPPPPPKSLRPTSWSRTEWLGTNQVALQWKSAGDMVVFRAEARAEGHVALSIGHDSVMIWFDPQGREQILDCHLIAGIPVADQTQDYELVFGLRNNTHVVFEFKRLIDTCDPDDLVITADAVETQWTLGKGDPRGIGWSGWQGARSLRFLNPKAHTPESNQPPQYEKWDVVLKNFEIPENMATIFWCKIFKVPALNEKHHIVGYRPTGKSGAARHAVLYECAAEVGVDGQWDRWAASDGFFAADMPREWAYCISPVAAWAIGSKGEMFPEHVGIPLGDHKGITYYKLEIHFENPTLDKVVDSVGLTILHTSNLRPHDAGVIVSGISVSPLYVLPAKQSKYKSAGYCAEPCTKAMIPENGINIVSVLLHAHSAGKKLSLRHIRSGQELPTLAEDDHYDYKNQQSRVLLEERNVLPGDELITECSYDTRDRSRPTLGGYSSKQEMCLAFILHYPRIPLAGCYSMTPTKEFFEIFGVREFYGSEMKDIENMFLSSGTPEVFPEVLEAGVNNKTPKDIAVQGDDQGVSLLGQLIIKDPFEFRNKSFIEHLNEIPWNETLLTKKIEDSLYKGKHMTFCHKRDDTLAVPIEIRLFPTFTEVINSDSTKQCQYKFQQNNSTSSSTNLMSNHITLLTIIASLYFI